jgi:DNA adenine methylase
MLKGTKTLIAKVGTPPLKWHGGKAAHAFKLARWIIDLMPPHLHYVEAFGGGLTVLLQHSGEGRSELANDINGDLTNFWCTLQRPETFKEFRRRVEAIPLSRVEWEGASDRLQSGDPLSEVERAVAFFVFCRQSHAGRMKNFTPPTRTRTRRGMNGNVSEWLGAVEGLADVHARLRCVLIECMDALKLIPREDGPETLFYLDPTYLGDTRAAPNVYANEMTREDHTRLLEVVLACRGMVMLSGYRSDLYDRQLSRWTRHDFETANHAAGGKKKRRMTESLWCNF